MKCRCESPTEVSLDKATEEREALRKNLERFGWTPVSVCIANAADNNFKIPSKEALYRLFSDPAITSENTRVHVRGRKLTFRTRESGAPGTVEPKQSWEISRARSERGHKEEEHPSTLDQLDAWIDLLQQVAVQVNESLGFPRNVLLQQNKPDDTIDLMRAFFYEPITTAQDSTESIMGSSPHTDWGSFTVVWQDDIGGLQTYCPRCHAWKDVPPPAVEENCEDDDGLLHFVVHVGDVTSLALRRAMMDSHDRSLESKETIATTHPTGNEESVVYWPSPKHRVLSPTLSPRVSLVYFAYPPPHRSLEEITKSLDPWCRSNPVEFKDAFAMANDGCFDDYYLLHNQSNQQGDTSSAKDRYNRIFHLSVKQVFQEKWQQVQRS